MNFMKLFAWVLLIFHWIIFIGKGRQEKTWDLGILINIIFFTMYLTN